MEVEGLEKVAASMPGRGWEIVDLGAWDPNGKLY